LNQHGIEIAAYVSRVGDIGLSEIPRLTTAKLRAASEKNIVRCPDSAVARRMITLIDKTRAAGDSLGGIVSCVIQGCPVGLGEPVFDRLHADLGKAMLSINAVKGFEYGSGFEGTKMRGSQHNDLFVIRAGKIVTKSNHSGGIQGGISNGMDIEFRVAFKPVATVLKTQATVNRAGKAISLKAKGRHDPCVVPRAVPIVEAMAALVLADHFLRARVAKGQKKE
ncbi:MAG: chorismate synthase, partial [Bdellovibrionota bacterium]